MGLDSDSRQGNCFSHNLKAFTKTFYSASGKVNDSTDLLTAGDLSWLSRACRVPAGFLQRMPAVFFFLGGGFVFCFCFCFEN